MCEVTDFAGHVPHIRLRRISELLRERMGTLGRAGVAKTPPNNRHEGKTLIACKDSLVRVGSRTPCAAHSLHLNVIVCHARIIETGIFGRADVVISLYRAYSGYAITHCPCAIKEVDVL